MNLSSTDRQRLNAAIKLKDTYNAQPTAAKHSVQLPLQRWEQLQRLERQIQKAEQRKYHVAAQRCRQRLHEQLRFFISELSDVQNQLYRTLLNIKTPSVRSLYEELLSLGDEFIEVDIDRVHHEIVVTTERIVLEDIDLGSFEIRLEMKHVSTSPVYRVIALEPNPASRDDSTTHPHVQSESLCEGDGRAAIQNALQQGRLNDFFVTVRQILRTYNSSSAYVTLEDWHGASCGDCGSIMDTDDTYCCERCEGQLCDHCTHRCNDCGDSLCYECKDVCEECEESHCSSCLNLCSACHALTCSSCLEDDLCPTCHEHQQDQTDAEPEDSSTDSPTSPPTTPETPTQNIPTDTAVQSVCMGEVAVPA